MVITKQIKRIFAPYGAHSVIGRKMGKSRAVVSRALAGQFDQFNREYETYMAIRKEAIKTYNLTEYEC